MEWTETDKRCFRIAGGTFAFGTLMTILTAPLQVLLLSYVILGGLAGAVFIGLFWVDYHFMRIVTERILRPIPVNVRLAMQVVFAIGGIYGLVVVVRELISYRWASWSYSELEQAMEGGRLVFSDGARQVYGAMVSVFYHNVGGPLLILAKNLFQPWSLFSAAVTAIRTK